jgi:hypothetical protein
MYCVLPCDLHKYYQFFLTLFLTVSACVLCTGVGHKQMIFAHFIKLHEVKECVGTSGIPRGT